MVGGSTPSKKMAAVFFKFKLAGYHFQFQFAELGKFRQLELEEKSRQLDLDNICQWELEDNPLTLFLWFLNFYPNRFPVLNSRNQRTASLGTFLAPC